MVFHGETGKITQITCFNKNCLKLFVFQREIEKIEKKGCCRDAISEATVQNRNREI